VYKLRISSRSCLSDAEVEALRGTLPNVSNYWGSPIDEDAIVTEKPAGEVIARLVTNCLSKKVVTESAKLFPEVHGDLSNRGGIVYRGAMMNRERTNESLGFTKAVPPPILQLLGRQNARLGLTGPYSDTLGFFDKRRRQPFCRPTAWSLSRPHILEISRPLVKEVEYVNKHELPHHWKRQHDFMKHVSQNFKYENSIFSTLTVNLNVRSAYHTDDGDFRGGM